MGGVYTRLGETISGRAFVRHIRTRVRRVLATVWATARMTAGHVLLAIGFTLYVLIALRSEERDCGCSLAPPISVGECRTEKIPER